MKKYQNKYGQFFTQKEMCESVLTRINKIKEIKGSSLEPSFGSGNFIEALSKYEVSIDGIEIDKFHFDAYKSDKANLFCCDFLDFVKGGKKYDFIVGNPPYIELCYSFYGDSDQDQIKKKYSGISNGRINLVHLFMEESMNMLNDDGVLAYLLPSSILTSPTYKKIRKKIYEKFSVVDLVEDVSFGGVAIKVSLLVLRKCTQNGKYFYLNGDNYFIMENYQKFTNTKTLKDYGFDVSIGEVVWNQKKNLLTEDNSENILVYSSNIDENSFGLVVDNNKEKKQYIKGHEVKYKNCIVFPRTISKKLKYHFIKNNENMIFENHLLVVTHSDINKLELFYNNLKEGLYTELMRSFFNSSNLTKGELLSLPF